MTTTTKRIVPLRDVYPGRDAKHMREAARAGRIPAFQLRAGGRWYVDLDEWERFLASRRPTQGSTAPAA